MTTTLDILPFKATADAIGERNDRIARSTRLIGRFSGMVDRLQTLHSDLKGTGEGLGFSIVHRIAEAHGGTVTMTDREGGGAFVELLL